MTTATSPSVMEFFSEPIRQHIRGYATLIQELFGTNVQALTVFGAAAAGTFDPQRHSVQNVLVVERVDLGMLRRLSERGLKLGKAHIAAPLIMTPDYIQQSLDTFPLELIEIQQKHVTLLGDDLFSELAFEESDVRLQCERELKVMCIALRQGLLAAAGRDKALAQVEVSIADELVRTLRGLLWLKGRREAQPASQVILEMENLAGRKLPGARAVVDPTSEHGWEQFESVYADVEALGRMVDAW